MFLPNQLELQTLFSGFLFGAGLSAVSVKNYLSDMRHFFSYCASISSQDNPPTAQEIFQNISKYLDSYLLDQKKSFTPQNTINRRSASIRRFSTFLASKFGLVSGLQDQKLPSLPATNTQDINQDTNDDSLPTIKKILDHFKVFLVKEKKTHSTVKNYVSDLNHFFAWSASETPFLDQNLENILSESHLNTYVTYLKLSHTSTSVINRRQSSIKQFARYCFLQKFIPSNPFEYKRETPRLLPLSWFDRFTSSKNKSPKKDAKSRLGIWYQKYNALPFTPYLHLAILALATSAMVIFGYNQIIKQAAPSSAALPTVPRRQLSFQGRLTDSSGTPITTSVNVVFKLWNTLPVGTGTQLYTSNTCAIVPDQNGIFNTLIGDGTCGAEIANTVFTENRDVYLEVTVGAETLSPRQQIATVGYALNSETLQGYPASATATVNTVPIVDNNGDINIAATSPNINSSSGTFTLSGQALTLTTNANSGGDIVLQPDAIGGGQIQMLGGTTDTDFLRIENANLTSGALISGYVGNNTATGRLLSLTSGSTETDRFYVAANGQTMINTAATLPNAALIVNQNGTGDLFTASASGANKFVIKNDGKVGIGTTAPSELLHLGGTGNKLRIDGPTGYYGTIDDVGGFLGLSAFGSGTVITFDVAGSEEFRISNGVAVGTSFVGTAPPADGMIIQGNVGIGTTNPISPLHVAKEAIYDNSDHSGFIVSDATNTNQQLQFGYDDALDAAYIQAAIKASTYNKPLLLNPNSGNVGIGLTNPAYKLDVSGDINLTGALRDNGSAGTSGQVLSSTGTGVEWVDNASLGTNYWVRTAGSLAPANITDSVNIGSTATASAFVHLAGTAAENSFINTGNFGVGLTNPGAKLTVQTTGTTDILNLFETGGTEVMTVLESGNVGIGITNPASKLSVAGGNIELGVTYRLTNTLSDPNRTDILFYEGGTASMDFTIRHSLASFRWFDGTTERMRITPNGGLSIGYTADPGVGSAIISGNLGIGLTNPTYDLDVVGDINLTGALRDNGNAGTSGQILSSTGTGVEWIAAPTGSGTQWWTESTDSVLYPTNITDAVNLGNAATASATVHLAGVAGDNSFINTGNFGIGLTNPTYDLDVVGDINLTGALRDNGNAGTSGQILSSTGTGVEWIAASSVGGANQGWTWSAGVLYPTNITDAVNLGNAATASATVHLAGVAGDNSFINTGNFGIGLTNPGSKLTVVGSVTTSGGNISLNDNSNFTTNINTGTSTGAVTIGGGSNTVAINSTSWVISTAGAASGFTGIASSGNIDFSSLAAGGLVKADVTTGRLSIASAGTDYQAPLTFENGLVESANVVKLGGTLTGNTDIPLAGFNLAFSGTGNVGIGLTNPVMPLHVSGNARFGAGSTAGTIYAGTFNAAYFSNGANLSLIAGATTGSILFTAGPSERMRIDGATGYVGIGLTNPAYKLDVSGDINLTGALRDNGNAGTSGQILSSTGTGIEWIDNTAGAQYWQWNGGVLSPTDLNDSVNLGAIATASATVHLAGKAGENSFINTGNFGVGVTNPVSLFSVGTGSLFQVTSAGAIAAATGIVSSGNIDFSSLAAGGLVKADVTTGRLGIATSGTDYQGLLTFENGLIESGSVVKLGGTLTGNTDIPLAGYNLTFSGTGNIGIGLTNPTSTLEIAGASSTISNASGDIILNAFSNIINFSGDSLDNFLNATASGQIKLGNFADASRPTPIGAGSLIYSTTQNAPQFYNGTSWQNFGENFWQRTLGSLAPANITDALNLGSTATTSAIVSFPGTTNKNAFLNLGTGNFGIGLTNPTQKLVVAGNIYPSDTVGGYNLGGNANPWGALVLNDGIYYGSTQKIAISSNRLAGGDWKVASGLRIGNTGPVPSGFILWVDGNASVSGTLQVDTPLTDGTADITVGGGAGKINVGTVDPPYTINGSKYATYMASMVGIKEETVGKVTTTEDSYIDGLGYRTLIDLDGQVVGTDIWLFSKTTNLKEHINSLSVLLTPEGQAKAWYEVDKVNKILAIYSSTPTSITYRLTAPRFDAAKWNNTRTDRDVGFVINDPNIYTNTESIFDNTTTSVELIAKIDGAYSLMINGVENKEVASFMKAVVANLRVGAAVVANLVADNLETSNLTVKTKLISPLADIEKLTVKDATVSGTLYAENIKGQAIDTLRTQINLLDEKYSTASSILADLQAQYSTYDSLFGATSSAIVTGDPLSFSPLAETTPLFPSDLALNSLNVHTLIANDLMANGAIFTNSISAFDTDLFIQLGNKPVHILADLMVLYPDGKVRINGDLLVTGNILAKGLDTQTATVSGSLAVGSSTIASESARFAQLTTDGLIIATGNDPLATISGQTNSNATIGTATIAAGTNEISIVNTTVTPTTLIYITPTSDTGGRVLFVKSKLENVGFTVAITGNSYTPSVSFNYWLIETK